MLEPAITVPDREPEKPVTRERRGRAEETNLRLAQLPQIDRDAVEVGIETPRDDELVPDAAGLELDARVVADLDRVIDQLVVGSWSRGSP